VAYLTAAIVTTLSVLESYSPIASFSSAIFGIYGTSHGLSAPAELLV